MLTFNELYQYVFGTFSTLDLTNTPAAKQEAKRQQFIAQMEEKFSVIPEEKRPLFRQALREVRAVEFEAILFRQETQVLAEDVFSLSFFPTPIAIQTMYSSLNKQYGYFSDDDHGAADKYLAYFRTLLLYVRLILDLNRDNFHPLYFYAYQALVIFGETNSKNIFLNFDLYLKNFNFNTPDRLINRLFLKTLPHRAQVSDLAAWQKLIYKHGHYVLRLFCLNPGVEFSSIPTVPNAEQALSAIARSEEHPELAKLCFEFGVEAAFNECLELEKIRKKSDNLPKVTIDGSEHGYPGYYLTPLPLDDPRVYLLGLYTNCCQHITGVEKQCVIDGLSLQNNGFYILLKGSGKTPFKPDGGINYDRFFPVGQCYAFITEDGNLLIDSWENKHPFRDNQVAAHLLKQFAHKVLETHPTISRVLIGCSKKTPAALLECVTYKELPREGRASPDTNTQAVIACRPDFVLKYSHPDIAPPKKPKALKEDPIVTDTLSLQAAGIEVTSEIENALHSLKPNYGCGSFSSALIRLKKLNLFSEKSLELVLSDPDRAPDVVEMIYANSAPTTYRRNPGLGSIAGEAIQELHKANMLNDKTRADMFKSPKNAYWLALIYITLNKANLFADYQSQISALGEHAYNLYNIGQVLFKAGMLNVTTLELALKHHDILWPTTQKMLSIGLLNDQTLNDLIQYPSDYKSISDFLAEMGAILDQTLPSTKDAMKLIWSKRQHHAKIILFFIALTVKDSFRLAKESQRSYMWDLLLTMVKLGPDIVVLDYLQKYPSHISDHFIQFYLTASDAEYRAVLKTMNCVPMKTTSFADFFARPMVNLVVALDNYDCLTQETMPPISKHPYVANTLLQILKRIAPHVTNKEIILLAKTCKYADRLNAALLTIEGKAQLTKEHVQRLLNEPKRAAEIASELCRKIAESLQKHSLFAAESIEDGKLTQPGRIMEPRELKLALNQ